MSENLDNERSKELVRLITEATERFRSTIVRDTFLDAAKMAEADWREDVRQFAAELRQAAEGVKDA